MWCGVPILEFCFFRSGPIFVLENFFSPACPRLPSSTALGPAFHVHVLRCVMHTLCEARIGKSRAAGVILLSFFIVVALLPLSQAQVFLNATSSKVWDGNCDPFVGWIGCTLEEPCTVANNSAHYFGWFSEACSVVLLPGDYGFLHATLEARTGQSGLLYITSNAGSLSNLWLTFGTTNSWPFDIAFSALLMRSSVPIQLANVGNVLFNDTNMFLGSAIAVERANSLTIRNSVIQPGNIAPITVSGDLFEFILRGSVISSDFQMLHATGSTEIQFEMVESSFNGPALVSGTQPLSNITIRTSLIVGINPVMFDCDLSAWSLTIKDSNVQGTGNAVSGLCSSQSKPFATFVVNGLSTTNFGIGGVATENFELLNSKIESPQGEIFLAPFPLHAEPPFSQTRPPVPASIPSPSPSPAPLPPNSAPNPTSTPPPPQFGKRFSKTLPDLASNQFDLDSSDSAKRENNPNQSPNVMYTSTMLVANNVFRKSHSAPPSLTIVGDATNQQLIRFMNNSWRFNDPSGLDTGDIEFRKIRSAVDFGTAPQDVPNLLIEELTFYGTLKISQSLTSRLVNEQGKIFAGNEFATLEVSSIAIDNVYVDLSYGSLRYIATQPETGILTPNSGMVLSNLSSIVLTNFKQLAASKTMPISSNTTCTFHRQIIQSSNFLLNLDCDPTTKIFSFSVASAPQPLRSASTSSHTSLSLLVYLLPCILLLFGAF